MIFRDESHTESHRPDLLHNKRRKYSEKNDDMGDPDGNAAWYARWLRQYGSRAGDKFNGKHGD
jgi:hypothetical protein